MLDAKLLRKDLESIKQALSKRGFTLDGDAFLALEERRKASDIATQNLQSLRKKSAKQVGSLIQEGLSVTDAKAQVAESLKEIDNDLNASLIENKQINDEIEHFLLSIPNIPDDDVPIGLNEEDNCEIYQCGEIPQFDFPVKDHVDLGLALDGLDFELATKLTGSRFVVMKKGIARLHRALTQFMLDMHVDHHGYEEVNVPFIANETTLQGTGQLPKFADDLFKLNHEGHDFYLIPTAESPLTNFVQDKIVEQIDSLPLKLVAHTPCFRREAGSYGRDVKGMIRQHQFEKVELVQIVEPESSNEALESLCTDAETILKKLALPYRKMLLCTGDMGFSACKTYDLEVWLPSQNTFREISSCSNTGDFQARRMKARFRNTAGKPDYLHTLNGSGLAVGRTLLAIIENYQQKDGTISIPAALKPYMGDINTIK